MGKEAFLGFKNILGRTIWFLYVLVMSGMFDMVKIKVKFKRGLFWWLRFFSSFLRDIV